MPTRVRMFDSCRGIDARRLCRTTKGGETPRQDWRGVSLVVDQWMVNDAEAATSYGVVVFLFNWTM
jgi:hypothetical protein